MRLQIEHIHCYKKKFLRISALRDQLEPQLQCKDRPMSHLLFLPMMHDDSVRIRVAIVPHRLLPGVYLSI